MRAGEITDRIEDLDNIAKYVSPSPSFKDLANAVLNAEPA
jgi:hypothetical protein